MGTLSDWLKVAIASAAFPCCMLLAVFILSGKPHIKPNLTPLYLLSWVFAGLFFGIWTTFGWNAFRWPLVLSLVGDVVGIVVFGKLAKRSLRQSAKDECESEASKMNSQF
jgi:hypothetical protein